MDKKGSEHVDWMISMGIFLVAIITVFLLIKPGIQREHSETVLLDTLQERFTNGFYWSVKKVPINIKVCSSFSDSTPEIKLDPAQGWSLRKIESYHEDNNECTDTCNDGENRGQDPAFPLANNIKCLGLPNNPGCHGTNSGLGCYLPINSHRIDIQYFVYSRSADDEAFEEFVIEDTTNLGKCVDEDDVNHCVYRIGPVEEVYGLNEEGYNFKKFINDDNFQKAEYRPSEIKKTWGFPESKEFFIKETNGLFQYETLPVEEGTSVFTRSFRTNLVNKYGDSTPVEIYFGVWG